MIIKLSGKGWEAHIIHTDDSNLSRFRHVTAYVLGAKEERVKVGMHYIGDMFFKGRLHFIRVEPEIHRIGDVFQGYMRFSYALEIGERISDELPSTIGFGDV